MTNQPNPNSRVSAGGLTPAPVTSDCKMLPPPTPQEAFKSPQIIVLARESVSFTVHSTKFIPASARAVFAGETPARHGALQTWAFTDGKFVKKQHFEAATFGGFKCCCVSHAPLTYRTVATGGVDGALALWDLGDLSSPVWSVRNAHDGVIYAIDGCAGRNPSTYGPPELVTAGADGVVRVWDPRQTTPVAELRPAVDAVGRSDDAFRAAAQALGAAATATVQPEAWAVALGGVVDADHRLVAAGYDNGDVRLWDLSSGKVVWGCKMPHGVVSLAFDRQDIAQSRLYVGMLEGRLAVVDISVEAQEGRDYGRCCVARLPVTLWFTEPLPQNRNVVLTPGAENGLALWLHTPAATAPAAAAGEGKGKGEGEEKGPLTAPGELACLAETSVGYQPFCSAAWSADFEGLFAACGYDQTVTFGVVTRLSEL